MEVNETGWTRGMEMRVGHNFYLVNPIRNRFRQLGKDEGAMSPF
jgi:hypothetical protein